MAQILLHGTLHATIFEAESLSNPHRASGGAPKFIRKVLLSSISGPLSPSLPVSQRSLPFHHARPDLGMLASNSRANS
jgi:hypothetical protein